jgi:hydrogenase maturation protease
MVVIGIGNEFRGDDAAGLAAARLLRNSLSEDVHVIEQSGDGAALLDAVQDEDTVILLDAVQSGAPPGTVHRLCANRDRIPRRLFSHSTHSFGVAEAIALGQSLHSLPSSFLIYGIEGENFAFKVGLSDRVKEAVKRVSREVANIAGPPALRRRARR